MNTVKIDGTEYPIVWDYGVMIDTAHELELEYLEDVYGIFMNWGLEGKTKIKTIEGIPVIIKHMIIAGGFVGELKNRQIMNDFFNIIENQSSVMKEIEQKSPKQENEGSKKKTSKKPVLTS